MRKAPAASADLADIQQSFADAFPRIEGLASAQHCRLRGGEKEEAVAETVALAWKAYRELALAGRDVVRLLGKIVEFSAKRVRCGRGLNNINPIRDVMSQTARFRHRHTINSLPLSEAEDTAPEVIEAVTHRGMSPADEAAFRVDLEDWIGGLEERRGMVARELASGLNTVEVGRLHRVTRARISQLREDLIEAWEAFNGGEGQ